MLACVFAIRNAISKVEIERLQKAILEEVALNHSEIFHVLASNLKFDTAMK
jgi:hypothetical protein